MRLVGRPYSMIKRLFFVLRLKEIISEFLDLSGLENFLNNALGLVLFDSTGLIALE